MALSETLRQLHERHQHQEEVTKNSVKWREEWKSAVAGLLETVRAYLAEYEEQGLLSFSEKSVQLSEPPLGSYEIASLTMFAGNATIIVQPVAFMITGAFGRVDVHLQGRSGDQDRVILLRHRIKDKFQWYISIPRPAPKLPFALTVTIQEALNPTPRQYESLTKESLERAIETLLK